MPAHPYDPNVIIHDDGEDGLWAEVAEMPGCFASGRNVEELNEALADAMGLYLASDGRQ